MQIVILMAFVAVLTLRGQSMFDAPAWFIGLSVAAYIVLAAVLGTLDNLLSLRRLRLADPSSQSLRRHNLMVLLVQGYLLAGLLGVVIGGLGNFVNEASWANGIPLLGEAILLAPFIAALLLVWLAEYPFHRALRLRLLEISTFGPRLPVWSLGEYIGYSIRHNLLFIAVPVGLIVLLDDLVRINWPAIERALSALLGYVNLPLPGEDVLLPLIQVALAGGVFLVAPMLVVNIWKTRPLPPGTLRAELEENLSRLHLRCREILLWQSGGVIANAGVIGLVAPLRYVLLSDALVENLPREHLQAVFAHEAGHISSHHILYAMVFAFSTMILAGCAWDAMQTAGLDETLSQVAALVALAVSWWLLFGRLSRAFERQSDVIGAWTVGARYNDSGDEDRITPEGAAIFAQALQQVAQLNGIPTSGPNWRHGSIEYRISYLFHLGASGGTRREIDARVRRLKRGLWVLLLCSIAVAIAQNLL